MVNPTLSTLYVARRSLDLPKIAEFLGVSGGYYFTDSPDRDLHLPSVDLLIFIIDAQVGVDSETISIWEKARNYQIPRLISICGLLTGENDFDDTVLILNRVLDPVITPYLVLHSDAGAPIGLISLDDYTTIDYSHSPPHRDHADSDLQEIVKTFRDEYLLLLDEYGVGGFSDGLLFPAIPLIPELNLGKAELLNYLTLLTPTL